MYNKFAVIPDSVHGGTPVERAKGMLQGWGKEQWLSQKRPLRGEAFHGRWEDMLDGGTRGIALLLKMIWEKWGGIVGGTDDTADAVDVGSLGQEGSGRGRGGRGRGLPPAATAHMAARETSPPARPKVRGGRRQTPPRAGRGASSRWRRCRCRRLPGTAAAARPSGELGRLVW